MVVPDPPLLISDGAIHRPVVYRLVTDCRYWHGVGHTGVDTSFIDLWKQHVVKVQGAAHRLHDGVRISEEVVVSPGPSVTTGFVANGITLAAEDTERYRFDHWSCSVELDGMDPTIASQVLTDVCWPLEDTVLFTAWYRDVTAHMQDLRQAGLAMETSAGQLHVTSATLPITTVTVSDVQGRLYAWREAAQNADRISIEFAAPPGFYLVVVRCGAVTTTLPLLYSP